MKINCGPSSQERARATENWHLWFAWRPVRVAERDCRWLEYVERKGEYDDDLGWTWEYRA